MKAEKFTEMGFVPFGTKETGVIFAVSKQIDTLPDDQKRVILEQLQNYINSQKKLVKT